MQEAGKVSVKGTGNGNINNNELNNIKNLFTLGVIEPWVIIKSRGLTNLSR